MTDEQLLKTIQNDIKNIDKCIEMCNSEEGINYLKSIKTKLLQTLRKEEIKIVKKMAIKKALKEYQHE